MRESVHSQSPALQCRVVNVSGVHNELLAVEDLHVDQSDLRAVNQEPTISGSFLPADVLRILPQQFDLIGCVTGVPQAVSQVLPGTGVAVDQLDLNARLGGRHEGLLVPVHLSVAFPGDRVESTIALVAEHESNVVIVDFLINEKCSLIVDISERIVSDRQSRIGIERLHHLSALVVDDPLRIFLVVADRIKSNPLESPEVGRNDFVVEWTGVVFIINTVAIEIFLTNIANSVSVPIELILVLKVIMRDYTNS